MSDTTNEILALLGSIIETDVCRKQLANSSWVSLLVGLLHHGSNEMQKKALKLIFQLLPLCSPQNLSIDIPPISENESEMISTMEKRATSNENCRNLILYFLRIIGIAHLPNHIHLTMKHPSTLPELGKSYVVLLRGLLDVPAWHDVVAEVIQEALEAKHSISQWNKFYLGASSLALAAVCVLGGSLGSETSSENSLFKIHQHLEMPRGACANVSDESVDVSALPRTLIQKVLEQFLEVSEKSNTDSVAMALTEGLHPLHPHKLALCTRASGWLCDGKHALGGCLGVGGNSGKRFRCTDGCDFDLCQECMSSKVQVRASEIRFPDGTRLPFKTSVDDSKLEIQTRESIEWVEDLRLVAQGSWNELDSSNENNGSMCGNPDGVLWAVMSSQQPRDIAFAVLATRLHTITATSNLLRYQPLCTEFLVSSATSLGTILKSAGESSSLDDSSLQNNEQLAMMLIDHWHSHQNSSIGTSDNRNKKKEEAPVESLTSSLFGVETPPQTKSTYSPFAFSDDYRPFLKSPKVELSLGRCLHQSLSVIWVSTSRIEPKSEKFLCKVLNFALNLILQAVWGKCNGAVRELTFDLCSEAIAEWYLSRGIHELLSITMEAISVRKLQGWEEDSAWGDASERLHDIMSGHALMYGVHNVDPLVANAIICCVEVISVDLFEFCYDIAQNDDPSMLDNGGFLDEDFMREVFEDQEGRVVIKLINDMEKEDSDSLFGTTPHPNTGMLGATPIMPPPPTPEATLLTPDQKQMKKEVAPTAIPSSPAAAELSELGFPVPWCEEALLENGGNVEASLNWILSQNSALIEAPKSPEIRNTTTENTKLDSMIEKCEESEQENTVDSVVQDPQNDVLDVQVNTTIEEVKVARNDTELPVLVESSRCYASLLGRYGKDCRWWDVPNKDNADVLNVSFQSRTESDIRVCFARESSMVEVVLSSLSCAILIDGQSVLTQAEKLCDSTEYLQYLIEVTTGNISIVSAVDTNKTPIAYDFPSPVASSTIRRVGFGGSSRVFFRNISVTRTSASSSFEVVKLVASRCSGAVEAEPEVEISTYDVDDPLDCLFSKPVIPSLRGVVPQDRGRRSRGPFGGMGGFGTSSSRHISCWSPSNNAAEFASQLESWSLSAVFERLEKVVLTIESLHAHRMVTQLLKYAGEGTLDVFAEAAGVSALESFFIIASSQHDETLERTLSESFERTCSVWKDIINSAKAQITSAASDRYQHENWDNGTNSDSSPSIAYVGWLTSLVNASPSHSLDQLMFEAWLPAFMSMNMTLKKAACINLATLLKRASSSGADLTPFRTQLPLRRIAYILESRIDMERESLPGASLYLKALFQLHAMAQVVLEPPAAPHQPLTGLRFHGTSGVRLGRQDLNKAPWTAEFWVVREGTSLCHRLTSSDHTSLLLRTTQGSGRLGCVGYSSGPNEFSFPYTAPTGKMVHLAYVMDRKSHLSLYADGVLVGVLPGTGAVLPLNCLGDPRGSFSGLMLGARFWTVDLRPEDLALASKSPMALICQSGEDCIGDFDLLHGQGTVVRDRSGDGGSVLVNATWETLSPEFSASLQLQEEFIKDVDKVTVVGVWTRTGSGDADKYGKTEKEPVHVTYWSDPSEECVEGVTPIAGEVEWFDSCLTASMKGTLAASGAVQFKVVKFVKFSKSTSRDADGEIALKWLLDSSFQGNIVGRKLVGKWNATRTVFPEPIFPSSKVLFSGRKSSNIEIDGNTVRLSGDESRWGSVLLNHQPQKSALLDDGDDSYSKNDFMNRSMDVAILRTVVGVPRGGPSVYFEVTLKTSKSLRIGFIKLSDSPPTPHGGTGGLGECVDSIGIDASGSKPQVWRCGKSVAYPGVESSMRWHRGSIVGCLLEPLSGVVRFSLDGHHLGVADVGSWLSEGAEYRVSPAVSLPNGLGVGVNFGQEEFVFTPPEGYVKFANPGVDLSMKASVNGSEWASLACHPQLWGEDGKYRPETPIPTAMSGRYLWEFSVQCGEDSENGFSGSRSVCIGVCRLESSVGTSDRSANSPGSNQHSWGMLSSGEKVHNDRTSSFSSSWRNGDVIGMELDMRRGVLCYLRNGKQLGEAFNDLAKFSGSDGGGLVPCVFLTGGNTQVTLYKRCLKSGVGSVKYREKDSLGRKHWNGDWFMGRRNGFGRLEYKDGRILEGCWCDDKVHGIVEVRGEEKVPVEEQLKNQAMYSAVFSGLNFKRLVREKVEHQLYEDGQLVRPATEAEVGQSKNRFLSQQAQTEAVFKAPSMYSSVFRSLSFEGDTQEVIDNTLIDQDLSEAWWKEPSPPMEASRDKGVVQVKRVTGTLTASSEHLFAFSERYKRSVTLSDDLLSAEMKEGAGDRQLVYGSRGFDRGVHYWEISIDKCSHGSMFIGVASGSKYANSWGHALGFESYRATLCPQNGETPYGKYYRGGDTMGVLLDLDKGEVSFMREGFEATFFAGSSTGRPTVVNMGAAFKNVRSHGHIHEKGERVKTTYFPVFGFSKAGDKITIRKSKWLSCPYEAGLVGRLTRAAEIFSKYGLSYSQEMKKTTVPLEEQDFSDVDSNDELEQALAMSTGRLEEVEPKTDIVVESYPCSFPHWLLEDAFRMFIACSSGFHSYLTRAGTYILANDSREAVEAVGGGEGLFAGDKVLTDRGQTLVLGEYNGYLWYHVDGEEWAWYWSYAEAVEVRKMALEALRSQAAGEAPVAKAPAEWACGVCTFLNPIGIPECSVCGSPCEEDEEEEDNEGGDEGLGSSGELETESDSPHDFLMLKRQRRNSTISLQPSSVDATVNEVKSLTVFSRLIESGSWDASLDDALVKFVNSVCDQHGCEAHQINTSVLLNSLNNATWQGSKLARLPHTFLIARFSILLILNAYFLELMPYVDLDLQTRYDHQGGIIRSTSTQMKSLKSILGQNMTSLRKLIFKRNKLSVWRKLIKATETYVSPPMDEYEAPSDIPRLKVNRIKANPLMLKEMAFDQRIEASLFGQIQREAHSWSDSSFRKSYVDIQDAGQERAFYVKFAGEGVDDHGGPYRAIFQAAVVEEPPILGLTKPCANEADTKAMNRDKVVFDPTVALKHYNFLGKLVGLAVRHSLMVPLNLPEMLWKPMVGLAIERRDLAGINKTATDAMRMVETWQEEDFEEESESSLDGLARIFDRVQVETLDDQGRIALKKLTFENRHEFIRQIEETQLTALNGPLSAFFVGLVGVLPFCAFPLFTQDELETLICGAPEIDIDLLKKVTEYQGEGVHADAPHVVYFWNSLEKLNQDQRSRFINFVSARSRLPPSADEFSMNFKIVEPKPAARENPDSHLPHSQTCFFTLSLPFYSSEEVCFNKLLYAIDNATTMDDDFQNRETWGDN